jgi:hypothetical protein
MKNYIVACFILIGTLYAQNTFSQVVPEHVSNEAIYEFIDELASEKIITIHSAIKPYTKQFITQKLLEAKLSDSLLNRRQKKEITFYLKAYQIWDGKHDNPYKEEKVNLLRKYTDNAAISFTHVGFVYRDTNFAAVAKPVWGTRYRTNDNGSLTHYWGGAEASASIGKHIGLWASVRDNTVSEILNWPGNFTRQDGGNYKVGLDGKNSGDYSETRGGISLGWKWGNVSLSKDHVQWGDHQNGPNIIDSRAPSFAMLKLHLNPVKWFEFDYLHGWLVSEVVDSALSYVSQYGEDREIFRPKYIASNMFTLHPWKYTSFSVGNSIIYSDIGAHPAYMIPFLFYKSVDHTLNHAIQNQNSQLFLNVSIRNIKHLHLYGSMFVDEFKKDRVGNDTLHNFFSYKGGLRLQNWPIPNVSLGYEFTHTYPITYKHRVQSTTFATNNYGLGHYLVDNSQEHYFSATIKPFPKFRLKTAYWFAFHANEYSYDVKQDTRIDALPVLQDKTWQNKSFVISASYEILQNVYVRLIYENTNIKGFDVDGQDAQYYLDMYTPAYYQGKQETLSFQFNIGF